MYYRFNRKIKTNSKKWSLAFICLAIAAAFLFQAESEATGTTPDKQIRIVWQDDNVKNADYEWQLFTRNENGTFGSVPDLTIPLNTASKIDKVYQTAGTLTITGEPGTTVRKYFAMKGVTGNKETPLSSEVVFLDFEIPADPLSAPYGIRVNVVITTQ